MRLVETRRGFHEYHPYIVPEVTADELAGDEEPPSPIPVAAEEVVFDEILAPAEMEELPAVAEEFFTPEEVPQDDLPRLEPPASEPAAEPIASEPPSESDPEPAATPDRPPEQRDQEPRGKSRRRRSGRKRNRRRGPEKGG